MPSRACAAVRKFLCNKPASGANKVTSVSGPTILSAFNDIPMSPRDTQWFLAGAATGLIVGALGFYLLFGSNTVSSNTVTQNTAAASPPEATQPQASTPNLLMPGDRWP